MTTSSIMNRLLRSARGKVDEPAGTTGDALAESEIRQVVERAAERAGIADPVAAARLVDIGTLRFADHGMPTSESIATALQTIANEHPELAGDGRAEMNDWIRSAAGRSGRED